MPHYLPIKPAVHRILLWRIMAYGILGCGTLLCGAPLLGAHAFLDRASPAVGSQVKTAPPVLRLTFTEALELAFSAVRVDDDKGHQVDKGDKHLDPADKHVLEVSLPPLAPGTYQVTWRALSVDTHVTSGHFKFEVLP